MRRRTTLEMFLFILLLAFLGVPTSLIASTLDTLVAFNTFNGAVPYAGLIQASDGNFYGTTYDGEYSGEIPGAGTVFKLTPAGTLRTWYLYTNGTGPGGPGAPLMQGSDGNFYGTSIAGGSSHEGTVFELSATGVISTLVNFNSTNGAYPEAGLMQGNDGNLYGTTYQGGSSNDGTVFKVTTTGTLTTLVSFNKTNGNSPLAGLIQGKDGNFYGTTAGGGASNEGTIFKLTSTGTMTTLVNFNSTNGANPYGGLIQGTDGNFYGTTAEGGTSNDGTTFKVTAGGTLTTLADFSSTNLNPEGSLIQASDGNFYGTTAGVVDSNYGTVFKLTPTGTLTTLINFNSSDGANPYGSLVQGEDGNLYGTTAYGAAEGTVFRLDLTTSENVTFSSASTIPIDTSDYTINGSALNLTLSYAPSPGTVLTVIQNTGTSPINGTFTNLPNGGTITVAYNGAAYTFAANYSGGAGHDLTLTLVTSASADTPTMPLWGLVILAVLLTITASKFLPNRISRA